MPLTLACRPHSTERQGSSKTKRTKHCSRKVFNISICDSSPLMLLSHGRAAITFSVGFSPCKEEHDCVNPKRWHAEQCSTGMSQGLGGAILPSGIYAFGVTMLFVTGYIPRPQGNWCIANITKKAAARQDSMSWLPLLQIAIARIPERL